MKKMKMMRENALSFEEGFEKRASVFGSMEYTELANACKAFPKFRVSVKTPKKKDAFSNAGKQYGK